MNRFVEAILTGAGFYAVDTSSKALAVTDIKKRRKIRSVSNSKYNVAIFFPFLGSQAFMK